MKHREFILVLAVEVMLTSLLVGMSCPHLPTTTGYYTLTATFNTPSFQIYANFS